MKLLDRFMAVGLFDAPFMTISDHSNEAMYTTQLESVVVRTVPKSYACRHGPAKAG